MTEQIPWKKVIEEIALQTKDSRIGGNWKAGDVLANGRVIKRGDSETRVDFDYLASVGIRNIGDLKRKFMRRELQPFFGTFFLRELGVRLIRDPSFSGKKLEKQEARPRVAPGWMTLENDALPLQDTPTNAITPRQEFTRYTYGQKKKKVSFHSRRLARRPKRKTKRTKSKRGKPQSRRQYRQSRKSRKNR